MGRFLPAFLDLRVKKMKNEFTDLSNVISKVFERLDENKIEDSNKLINAYNEIVRNIAKSGKLLKEHTRVHDVKNGKLYIESDHPGLSFLLQLSSHYIISELKKRVGETKITALRFRVKTD